MVILALLLGCAGSEDSAKVEDTAGDSGLLDTGDPDTSPDSGDSGDTGDTADTADTPPTDADGDGFLSDTDCNDADPAVHPDAYDWCDGVDQDCDGSAQGEGACGEIGLWSELDVTWWEGSEANSWFGAIRGALPLEDGSFAALGAFQGLHTDTVATDWSGLTVVAGIPSAGQVWSSAALGTWVSREYVDNLDKILAGGDVNGDGHEDLWLTSEGQSGCCEAGAYLVLGPPDRWPKEAAYVRDVADGWWRQAVVDDNFGASEAAGEDIDGDGLADAVFLASDDIWDGTGGSVHVVRGRASAMPTGGSVVDEITLWKSDEGLGNAAASVRIGPDIDADGAREVLVGASGYGLSMIWGADLTEANHGYLESWVALLQGDLDGRGYEFPRPDAVPGDLDGDGIDEFIVDDSDASTGPHANESCIDFISGPDALSDGTLSTGTLARACIDNVTGSVVLGADVDLEGIRDLIIGWRTEFTDSTGAEHGIDSLSCILPSSRLALGGRVEVPDVSLCYHGGASTTADLDGDGLAEIIGVPQDAVTTYENAGRTDVLPGFAIPWDDPSKW